MQLLVDFFPLIAFLGAYFYWDDIFSALQVLMVAMPLSFLIKWWITKKIDKMLLGSTVVLLVMGSITLIYRNPVFLFWKPTVFYWIAAAVFLSSHFIGDKLIAERLFAALGDVPAEKWRVLNITWVLFFVAAGFLNLYVAYNFTEAFWVKFKVFGFTGITFAFIVLQMIWLTRNMTEQEPQPPEAD